MSTDGLGAGAGEEMSLAHQWIRMFLIASRTDWASRTESSPFEFELSLLEIRVKLARQACLFENLEKKMMKKRIKNTSNSKQTWGPDRTGPDWTNWDLFKITKQNILKTAQFQSYNVCHLKFVVCTHIWSHLFFSSPPSSHPFLLGPDLVLMEIGEMEREGAKGESPHDSTWVFPF